MTDSILRFRIDGRSIEGLNSSTSRGLNVRDDYAVIFDKFVGDKIEIVEDVDQLVDSYLLTLDFLEVKRGHFLVEFRKSREQAVERNFDPCFDLFGRRNRIVNLNLRSILPFFLAIAGNWAGLRGRKYLANAAKQQWRGDGKNVPFGSQFPKHPNN